ncbi:MAG TPA: hypothetical protein VKA84_24705 [Gemmatimonadaceae bacterium]|nr:hypothetical protein [Gemmatimonadaceae bacterium]
MQFVTGLKRVLALALLAAVPSGASAQRPRCVPTASTPRVLYASIGSATGAHRRLNGVTAAEGFAPLAENAIVGGLGFWMTNPGGCSLLQLEVNVVQWEPRTAPDGRRMNFWAGDVMLHAGAPVVTSGRTSVYPLLGVGVRIHFLEVTGANPDAAPSPREDATRFAMALRRNDEWEGPGQVVGDLAVGAHYLAGSPSRPYGLVIGARMGYIVGAAYNKWISGADTIRGPMVNTSGPYGRLLVGMSFGRRDGAPPPRPPAQPEDEPHVRDGRPTRRIG